MSTQKIHDLAFEKGLPSAPEAERYVLAAAMLGQPLANITAVLDPADFSIEKHRRIFAAMLQLEAEGMCVDRIALAYELRNRDQLESVDGLSYLASLDEGMPQIVNLDGYCSIVRDKAVLRRAIMVHQKAITECLAPTDPTPEILARAEASIAALSVQTRQASFRMPAEVVERAGGVEAFLNPDKRRGVETPWSLLNKMLVGGGFRPGLMIVIGARPSIGKTALACQISDYAATHGTGVGFFTLEMPADAILFRMAAARAQVDSLKVTQGRATKFELDALREAFADLTDESTCKLWIEDTTCCTVPAMRAALRRRTARHPIGLLVIDYLQLVETSGGSVSRYEQVSAISRGIKRLAMEFSLPVVVLSQLNRESEKDGRKPRLSDLRDSGSIEQDADLVLLPTRREGQDEQSDVVGVEINIAKQRNGPLGRVPLEFLKRYTKFIESGQRLSASAA